MHVAMVTPFPQDPERPENAMQVIAVPLIRSLIRLGVRVTVINCGSRQAEPYTEPSLGCTVVPLPLRPLPLIANWLRSSREVRTIVEEVGADVVHMQAQPEFGAALKRPRVFTLHGVSHIDEWLLGGARRYITAPIKGLSFWWFRKQYDHVIMISPYSHRIGGFRRGARLHDVPNPIEDRYFNVERGPFAPRVLMVAPLSELKNTLGAVQVSAAVRDALPEVQFRIAGPWRTKKPGYRQDVERFCEAHDLHETVRFLGYVDRNALMAELASAACLLLPSFQENAPLAIGEAMAAGLPVLASRIGGIPWMVEEGKAGLLFDPRNQREMAESLIKVLRDPALCERMGRAAREEAHRRFKPDVVARQTLDVYQQAIDDYGR